MTVTETTTTTFADLPYSASLYSYECGGVFHKIARVERKRVNAVVHWVGGSSETVRLDEERRFQREVLTDEEREAETVAYKLDAVRRFVESAEVAFTSAAKNIGEKQESGPLSVTSFDLDRLLTSTAHGNVAARVRHAVLLPEDMTDAQRLERAQEMCSNVLAGFWGSQSTSNSHNQLNWLEMAAWGDLARDVARGW